jgi:hypothetical protein
MRSTSKTNGADELLMTIQKKPLSCNRVRPDRRRLAVFGHELNAITQASASAAEELRYVIAALVIHVVMIL